MIDDHRGKKIFLFIQCAVNFNRIRNVVGRLDHCVPD
jgi:hypothetical protein